MRGEEQDGVLAARDQHRARLALGEIFFADQPAVLAGRHPDRHGVAVVHHHAIGAGIDPAVVGIAHDDDVVGADIAATVMLVDHGHRELEQIDGAVAIDVLQHRARPRLDRRDGLGAGVHAVAVGLHQLGLVCRSPAARTDTRAGGRCCAAPDRMRKPAG